MRRTTPVVLTAFVTLVFWILAMVPPSGPWALISRLEWLTYDWRARLAAGRGSLVATNLGAVFISDSDLKAMNDGSYGYREKFPWPTHFYGRVIRELSNQRAQAVGFDMLFELLDPGISVSLPGGSKIGSDEFFAARLKESGIAVLVAEPGGNVLPADLFRTNAITTASIATVKDADGVVRRARAITSIRVWHPLVKYVARAMELDLTRPRFELNRIVFPSMRPEIGEHAFPLNADGSLRTQDISPGTTSGISEPACMTNHMWNLGIVLAARVMGIDLDRSVVQQTHIALLEPSGRERLIPIDREGCFSIDWVLNVQDPRIRSSSIVELIRNDDFRQAGIATNAESSFSGRLVVVGAAATGGNVTDLGTTPLSGKTPLVMQHLNVANSIITGRFIGKAGLAVEMCLIAMMAVSSAWLTWNLRALVGSAAVAGVAVIYVLAGAFFYICYRYWIPFILPLGGGLLATHISLITLRVRSEQRERYRIRSVFSKIVSPEIVNELLKLERVSLNGARRRVSVFFADIRGFTGMTDQLQAEAEEHIRLHSFSEAEAEQWRDRQARDILDTVNLYLGVIADTVIRHRGTLDKYIGDCVMAFWGAPAPSDRHALDAVMAAIDAQRAVYRLNVERAAENRRREELNRQLKATAKPLLPQLTLLALGTGINTGFVTVGLMGSETHGLNYTVFGREVNLASRLEGSSGRGRIIIGDDTHCELVRLDSNLAARCTELPLQPIKGFRERMKIWEVHWRDVDGDLEDYDTAVLKGDQIGPATDIVPRTNG